MCQLYQQNVNYRQHSEILEEKSVINKCGVCLKSHDCKLGGGSYEQTAGVYKFHVISYE